MRYWQKKKVAEGFFIIFSDNKKILAARALPRAARAQIRSPLKSQKYAVFWPVGRIFGVRARQKFFHIRKVHKILYLLHTLDVFIAWKSIILEWLSSVHLGTPIRKPTWKKKLHPFILEQILVEILFWRQKHSVFSKGNALGFSSFENVFFTFFAIKWSIEARKNFRHVRKCFHSIPQPRINLQLTWFVLKRSISGYFWKVAFGVPEGLK